jgi:hypothetical protein
LHEISLLLLATTQSDILERCFQFKLYLKY